MAPSDALRPPFRWEFIPLEDPRDHSIHWTWRAYDQAGNPVMESVQAFDSRIDCVEDAKACGYSAERGH